MSGIASAPTFEVATREVVAVEHPMVIKNIDKALKTFGSGVEIGRPFKSLVDLDDPDGCIPIYLRHRDPMSTPILSHNCTTNNILLKVTVPKRTGRKRKRGSQEPYSGDITGSTTTTSGDSSQTSQSADLRSHSRLDNPRQLLRSLKDNVGNYTVEGVAEIDRTHRFRGLADFYHSTSNTEFVPKFLDLVYPGEMESIRKFKFNPSRGWKKNEEFVPPPILTNHVLPFNWGYHQNPNIVQTVNQSTGESALINRSRSRKFQIEYLSHDVEEIPQTRPLEIPREPDLEKLIEELNEALEERPLWTRRALANRLGNSPRLYLFKTALQYVGYQFKGGPFRDVVIKFGIDPRKDPKYRIYQTIFFKLYEEEEKGPFRKWHEVRSTTISKRTKLKDLTTHLFDGKSLTLDGKVWQFCDVTDPFLVQLINNAPVCHEFNSKGDGYFYNGSWAKIRAVMKMKLMAIRIGKTIKDEDFESVLSKVPDIVDNNEKASSKLWVPLPDVKFTDEEIKELEEKGVNTFGGNNRKTNTKSKARKTRIRHRLADLRQSREPARVTDSETLAPSVDMFTPNGRQSWRDQNASSGRSNPAEAPSNLDDSESARVKFEMALDAEEESALEDEYSEDAEGETDLEDDVLPGEGEDEEDDSDASDMIDYSKYYIPRGAPAAK